MEEQPQKNTLNDKFFPPAVSYWKKCQNCSYSYTNEEKPWFFAIKAKQEENNKNYIKFLDLNKLFLSLTKDEFEYFKNTLMKELEVFFNNNNSENNKITVDKLTQILINDKGITGDKYNILIPKKFGNSVLSEGEVKEDLLKYLQEIIKNDYPIKSETIDKLGELDFEVFRNNNDKVSNIVGIQIDMNDYNKGIEELKNVLKIQSPGKKEQPPKDKDEKKDIPPKPEHKLYEYLLFIIIIGIVLYIRKEREIKKWEAEYGLEATRKQEKERQ